MDCMDKPAKRLALAGKYAMKKVMKFLDLDVKVQKCAKKTCTPEENAAEKLKKKAHRGSLVTRQGSDLSIKHCQNDLRHRQARAYTTQKRLELCIRAKVLSEEGW